MPSAIGSRWREQPRKIRSIEFNQRKIVWLEIREQMVRVRANDFPRIKPRHIAWPVQLHGHINFLCIVHSQPDGDREMTVRRRGACCGEPGMQTLPKPREQARLCC